MKTILSLITVFLCVYALESFGLPRCFRVDPQKPHSWNGGSWSLVAEHGNWEQYQCRDDDRSECWEWDWLTVWDCPPIANPGPESPNGPGPESLFFDHVPSLDSNGEYQ